MVKTVFMRGLQNFIEEIRACENKEQEEKRIQKELAKIREKFGDGDKDMTGYDKRKYVWKLLYISILGYKVDFGHRQACDLIPKPKYKDKQVGYMACTILLNENDEFLRLAINGVHQDLVSRNEAFECLALNFVGSVGGQEMAEALVPDILKLLSSGSSRPLVKKRAALCLLRMMRKTPADQQVVNPDTFCSSLNALLEERDLGLVLSCVTLLCGIVARSGTAGYESCQSRVIRILERLVLTKDKDQDIPMEYQYYGIPSPWLQSKALRTLQYYPVPEAAADRQLLINILQAVIDTLTSVDHTKITSANKNNALYAIILEAIALSLHLDIDDKLMDTCITTLGKLLTTKEPNVKYLALESLARLAGQPEVVTAIRSQRQVVSAALLEPDVATRKRALDLLFAVCDSTNARELVAELLDYLVTADFALREELVLKIAILAEKYAPDVQWYIDTLFRLLETAGDFVSEEIWQRVSQLVTNNESMQEYAALRIVDTLRRGASHESVTCTAAYLLGEYGRLIKNTVPCLEQYKLLHELFAISGHATKALLMSAFLKIYIQDSENDQLKAEVLGTFDKCQTLMDAELQQRAAEYKVLAAAPHSSAAKFLLPMPKWPVRESTLLRQLQRQEGSGEDGAVAPAAAASPARLPSQASDGAEAQPTISASSSLSAPAVASKLPSINLLGESLSIRSSVSAARDPFDVLATSPAVPTSTQSNNPLDLLGELYSSNLASYPQQPQLQQSPSAPAPAPAPALAPHSTWHQATSRGAAQPPPTQSSPQASAAPVPGYAASAPSFPPGSVAASSFAASSVPSFASAPTGAAISHSPGSPNPNLNPHPVTGASPTWQNPAPVPPAAAAFEDPFGDAAFGPPVVAAPSPTVPAVPFEPVRVLGDLQAWFHTLLRTDRGVLYEDQYLQVGAQVQYADGRGNFVLFLGNKSEHPLQHVRVLARPSSSVHAVAGPFPSQMLPKQQLQVPVAMTCMSPVVDVPVVCISYMLGNVVVNQELAMPVATYKFVMPEPAIPRDFFFEQWKALSGSAQCKVQQMVNRSQPATYEMVVAILRQANLGVEHCYLDPSPHNEAGAGYFVYGPPGAQQRTLLMCRVEGNPQGMTQFRVTVVSPIPSLSASTLELVASLLT